METGLSTWRRSIRELYDSFRRTDEELKLLRDIDRSVLDQFELEGAADDDVTKSVERVFADSLVRLTRMHGLHEPGRCYVYVGEDLLALDVDAPSSQSQTSLRTPKVVVELASVVEREPKVLGRHDQTEDLFEQLGEAQSVLLQPIYEAETLFAVLLFTDREQVSVSPLNDPELMESVATVGRQLSIAYSHSLRVERERRSAELWNLFIDSNLAPTVCFKQLATMARGAYPTFGPLKLEEDPEVQILVLEHAADGKPLFLTIRGTTGGESINTKIKIEESISGLLIEEEPYQREFFCDDPRKEKYRDVYKSYLGQGAGTAIKTEFAVRLIAPGGRLIGVLNFESAIENALNLRHQTAILEFADRIARMVEVFEERIDHNRAMQLSVSSVTSKYLDSLAGIFRHGVASPLLGIRGDVEAARSILDEKIRPLLGASVEDEHEEAGSDLASELSKLSLAIDGLGVEYGQVYEFTRDFGDEISGFGDTGRFDLRELIDETVSLAQRSYLAKADTNIAIRVDGKRPAYAFCTRLFKQHFFSLLTNAIYSLQEKARLERGDRYVEVTIEAHSDAGEAQEADLNRGWLVKIRDNGMGVDEETLAKLKRFQPGSHYRSGAPGLGLGLVAMQRYMGSIGGWVSLDSESGEFFEVRLLFDEYSEAIHGPLSIINGGGGNGS
jgi:signal transduction histidine kinase